MPNFIGDWLEQTKESQPTVMDRLSLIGEWAKQQAPMLFPSEWERYAEMSPLQRQGAIGQEAMSLMQPTAIGYHGSLNPEWFAKNPPSENWQVLDRMIGPHFAKDPRVANKFAEGLYRVNKGELYNEAGERSIWGKPKIPEGGNIKRAYIPDELHKVPQPRYNMENPANSNAIKTDQVAITEDIARTVFPERKDLFSNWAKRVEDLTDKEVDQIHSALMKGEPVRLRSFEDFSNYKDFGDFVGNYDVGLNMMSDELRPQIVDAYKEILKNKGLKGVRYLNTSPNEVAKGESRVTYIPFDVEDIKPEWR